MNYIGKTGKTYTTIEPALGKGGEGSVYRISGMPDYVLKVFLDAKRTESRHRKLLAMIATPLSLSAMQQVTWPIDVVYDGGRFVGYVMPAIKNNEDLNVMYSDKYICTLSEKITIAKNLCAAINAVHEAGQVCGDLNPKNIGVDPQSARVTLVDTDSYHITEQNGNRIYRCEVGLPEYLPAEVQVKMTNGQTLATAPLPTFTKYTDLFALAVHIFALLMNGCHPFACAINNKDNINPLRTSQPSVTAPQPIDNICNGFFPFYTKKAGITTPKYAPSFDVLPKNIQDLFVKAFVNGHTDPSQRPTPEQWYVALGDMQQKLTTCSKEKSHMYASHNKKCPWCAVTETMNAIVPVTNKSNNTQIGNNTNGNKLKKSKPQGTIKRSSWPMWVLFILLGCITGPIEAHFIAMPLVYDYIDASIPMIVGYIVMAVIGALSGVFISHFAHGRYETANKGWPWMLLSLCVPLLTLVATAVLVAAIAIVIGVVYIALFIIVLIVGGAIAAACCGGG